MKLDNLIKKHISWISALGGIPFVVLANDMFSDWNWDLSPENVCQGSYNANLDNAQDTQLNNQLPIHITADESDFTPEGDSHLKGDVVFSQGYRQLKTDELRVQRTDETINLLQASGHVHYQTPTLAIMGQSARYYPTLERFELSHGYYRWYQRHARGSAKRITVDKATNLFIQSGTYTTCSPSQNTWVIAARELKLNRLKGRATVKGVTFRIKDIPVFYFPYFNYPIDNNRHSGLLAPHYGSSSQSGREFIVPFYWNIAPNYDFIFTTRLMSERGAALSSKLRYLTSNSLGDFQWTVLPHDRKYSKFLQEIRENPSINLYQRDLHLHHLHQSTRHAINFKHSTTWLKHWQLKVLFDYVSDDNYFVDLENDIAASSTTHLPQLGNLSYYGEHWTHFFNVEEYQVLQPISKPLNPEIYRRQPEWSFDAVYPNIYRNLWLGFQGQAVQFNHQQAVTKGRRFHLRPSIALPLQKSAYYFTPRLQIDYLGYDLDLASSTPNLPKQPHRVIPIYDVDTGVFFERKINCQQQSFKQTLEPRLYYLYVPYLDQSTYPNFDSGIITFNYSQLFRDNRFSGRDRLGDANQLSLSLTTRLYPINQPKEWLRASLGQIVYFRPRRVALEKIPFDTSLLEDRSSNNPHSSNSHLIGEVNVNYNDNWSSGAFWEWDQFHRQTEQAAFNVQYHSNLNKIFNVNYYWERHDLAQIDLLTGKTGSLHQVDFSVLWPLTPRWQFLGRWHYDLKNRQNLELIGGFEYSACCVALQLFVSSYRQDSDAFAPIYANGPDKYAKAIFAQVVFRGLASLPFKNPDEKLKTKINGYTPLSARQLWKQAGSGIPLY